MIGKNYKKEVGNTFNYLTVVGLKNPTKHGNPQILCRCVCGNETVKSAYKVVNGTTKSCGCMMASMISERTSTHGMSNTAIYRRWRAILNRCYRESDIQYKDYGGRGIEVCKRWHKFENFYKDMGDPPPNSHIDRKNNDRGYCKPNCKWVSIKDSMLNTRRKVIWTVYGEDFLDINEAAVKYEVSRATIQRWCGADKNRPHMKKEDCSSRKVYE